MLRAHSPQSYLLSLLVDLSIFAALALAIVFSAGCDRKEKVIEVNTPNKEVEVTRDKDTGRVEVNVESNR